MVFTVVYVTHADRTAADKLVNVLLEEKLIACANAFPVTATSGWTGTIEACGEVVTLLKTRSSLWPKVKQRILDLHPYDVPCIMRWDVEANASYEDWINKETKEGK